MAMLCALLATFSIVATSAQPYRALRDLEYDQAGNLLDLYLPEFSDSTPLRLPVVFVAAGTNWETNNGKELAKSLIHIFGPRGFAVAGIDIKTEKEARFPEQILRMREAIRYCRTNAHKYVLDPTRFAFVGSGTGGWAAAMAATTSDMGTFLSEQLSGNDMSSAIQSAVAIFPATDFRAMSSWYDGNLAIVPEVDHDSKESPESRLIDCPIQECEGAAKQAGASYYVNPEDPDIWFIHGDSDPLVPLGQSELMFSKYTNARGDRFTAFTTVKGAAHVLDDVVGKRVLNFTTQLTDRKGRVGLANHMRPTWNNIARFFVSSFKRV